VTKIDALEDNFQIDEYADLAKTTKPVVYISPVEIINTHALLLEHLEQIAPAKEDPLRTILTEIGDPPAVDLDSLKSKSQGYEISITLTNKFAVQGSSRRPVGGIFDLSVFK
jgi:Ras GTPase-activating-like protein IQGAP2/3